MILFEQQGVRGVNTVIVDQAADVTGVISLPVCWAEYVPKRAPQTADWHSDYIFKKCNKQRDFLFK